MQSIHHTACLLLGSNQGPREVLLRAAADALAAHCGSIIKISAIYETEPWGFEADTWFLNQAVLIDTLLPPVELLLACQNIEQTLGREKFKIKDSIFQGQEFTEQRYASRSMDIDILLYDQVVCETPELWLPHPRLHLRAFVLEPLSELLPDWIHPVLDCSAAELLSRIKNSVHL